MSSVPRTSPTPGAGPVDTRLAEPAIGGLPLPDLATVRRTTTARYALTTADRQGRLADRSSLKALGWAPGQPISITAAPDFLVIRAATHSRETLTGQGFLQLPAALRRRYHILPGDQLLIAAYPDRDLALICTPAALDQMIDTRVRDLL